MRKVFIFLFLMVFVMSLTSCGEKTETVTQEVTPTEVITPEVTETEETVVPTEPTETETEETVVPTEPTETETPANSGDKTPTIYLAGDSTVKTYDDGQYIAGWGQYLSAFLNENIKVVNCANGGRSSRSFINEGRLMDIDDEEYNYSFSQNSGKSIESCIKSGDYLFIQFGHNDDDTKKSSSYSTMYDRMIPLGEPDENGIYPVTPGVKVSTDSLPEAYTSLATDAEESKALTEIQKYGSQYYAYDCGGTYKWFLKQYIDFARSVGATPVLVTPVARVKFSGDKIVGGAGLHGENFAYVEAVRQLANEENCLLIDLFDYSKDMLETLTSTYANFVMALKPNDLLGNWPSDYDTTYGNTDLGYTGIEGTHYNKYGAYLQAAKVAETILNTKDLLTNGECFNFYKGVLVTPNEYVDPSNLISKTIVKAVEGKFELVNVTNPGRTYKDASEVISLIATLETKGEVTAENHLALQKECEDIRNEYISLNIDDRPLVINITILEKYENDIKDMVEALRPKPSKVVEINAENLAVGEISSTLECEGFKVVGSATNKVEIKSSPINFSYSGNSYSATKYFDMKGSKKNDGRYIEFSVDDECYVTVVAKSGGDRTIGLYNLSNSLLGSFSAPTTQTITTLKIEQAGTYTMGSMGSGVHILYIIIEYFDGSSSGSGGSTDEPTTPVEPDLPEVEPEAPEGQAEAKLYVVGDSTLASFSDSYYYPRYGYATQLDHYLYDTIEIVNLAISGRSSKNFILEDNYQTLKTSITAGDYLLIGFGHNDEKSDSADRFTDASKDVTDETSFKYYLYNYYVKLAIDAGATPILCTPVVRANPNNDYTGSSAHITATGDYRLAIMELGEAYNVTVVDLTTITKEAYTELGYNEALYFHAITAGKYASDGTTVIADTNTVDKTHLNIYGARFVAHKLCEALKASTCELGGYVHSLEYIPTKANTLVSNPNYVVPTYESPNLTTYSAPSHFQTITEGWYGTGFGDTGGSPAAETNGYIAKETSSGIFTVGQTGSSAKGKIAGSNDGFAFLFRQVEASKNFTLTAEVKVLTVKESGRGQDGFGLMLRDDIYLNVQNSAILSNYVAAGFLCSSSNAKVLFDRENKVLTQESNSVSHYVVDDTATLSIERVGQEVKTTVVFKGTTYTQTYTDFDFQAIDNGYMYIGIFANRGTTIECKNVQFEITGESQGA